MIDLTLPFCQYCSDNLYLTFKRFRTKGEIAMFAMRIQQGRLARAVAVTLAVSFSCLGQQNVGAITGTVTDPSGGVIPTAAVAALHQATGQKWQALTNSNGIYVFRLLPI